jgi:hypothetical protein
MTPFARRAAGALLAAGLSPRPAAAELEIGAQAVLTLVADDRTKAGGVGPALEASLPLVEGFLLPRATLLGRARAGALVGAGLAWAAEAGAAWRLPVGPRWEPELGASLLYLDGDLVRTVDDEGRLAGAPVAALLGVTPARFRLEKGWVSFLPTRLGAPLGRGGRPPLALSIALVEVGARS